MPTECERSNAAHVPETTLLQQQQQEQLQEQQKQLQEQQLEQQSNNTESKDQQQQHFDMDTNGEMSTSQNSNSSANGQNGQNGQNGRKTSITSPDPTEYVAKQRITRPTPPPPSYNPMQFVQIKPCHLYQTAQEQLKKAEEVKKIKEIKKEEPEDWQNNLDNWKSSRRKRVEHIIERCVEVKKLEEEDFDRQRRKSKTFSEMMEERDERGGARARVKLASLAVYNEDESNDLSDLGIGTSSASGKSSLSEDYDNNSVMSDHGEHAHKPIVEGSNHKANASTTREYISSPGYDTSSSTAPASSPDPCEYTYEGAIQDYKQRVSRASLGSSTIAASLKQNGNNKTLSKESSVERNNGANSDLYPIRRGSKIEDRLMGFEVSSPSDNLDVVEKIKVDVPKIDISKRKEIFEMASQDVATATTAAANKSSGAPRVTLRNNFVATNANGNDGNKNIKRLSGDISSIKQRLHDLEQQKHANAANNALSKSNSNTALVMDIPVPPLKERLSSLQSAVSAKEEVKKPPVALVDARQLEIMKNEDETAKQRMQQLEQTTAVTLATTTNADNAAQQLKQQEEQLNAAIAALALEEQQLEAAANAANQNEAEFAEIANASLAEQQPQATAAAMLNMECSVSADKQNLTATPTTTTSTPTSTKANPKQTSSSSNSGSSGATVSVSCPTSSSERINVASSVNAQQSVLVSGHTNVTNANTSSSTAAPQTVCKLNRKPSNEMVHARNLLKMFKETFKDDIALDEEDVTENMQNNATKSIPINPTTTITTQIFESSTHNNLPTTNPNPNPTASMIPRSIANCNPTGKPPMSPKSARYATSKLPQQIATAAPKPENHPSQFSINGRVEIFNSKNMSLPATTQAQPTHLQKTINQPQSLPAKSNAATTYVATTSTKCSSLLPQPQEQQQEVIICAPPITILNPDELPKPNTVKALSSCFNATPQNSDKVLPPMIPPKPLPRSRIPKTPPQSPTPAKRQLITTQPTLTAIEPTAATKQLHEPANKTLSVISNSSSISTDSLGHPSGAFETKVIVHSAPKTNTQFVPKPADTVALAHNSANPLAPNDDLYDKNVIPAELPPLLLCAPNESSLFKLANSAPQSPASGGSKTPLEQNVDIINSFLSAHAPQTANENFDVIVKQKPVAEVASVPQTPILDNHPIEATEKDMAIINSFLSSRVPHETVAALRRQSSVDEIDACKKLDVSKLPRYKQMPCTIYDNIDAADLRYADDPLMYPSKTERQQTVEEELCAKVDIADLPPHLQPPSTGFANISEAELVRCDNFGNLDATPTQLAGKKSNSKPNSPIMAARAAHSKALIETCERIIAEERAASNHIKSTLPISGKSTPVLPRKSKIPKPMPYCCIGSSGSKSEADYAHEQYKEVKEAEVEPKQAEIAAEASNTTAKDDDLLIARLHVVETQIKVTTSTPPTSPKPIQKTTPKKSKNIFDFIKSTFGYHDEPKIDTEITAETEAAVATTADTDTVKVDEILTVDNSKFYLPSDDMPPPPLPKTPAPVNIEITKKITTDEIVEDNKSEQALTQEINELLDDELNKLNVEIIVRDEQNKAK